ncbi:phosphodiester glycosidase family protein [Desulfolucanica intricata]|uniref:phosphodiester glycosidase family protein n=1 Tax=Desulfolucanica intricata TaxID=1285191 RepID=UPI00083065D5|nr:phosphodiester glycosidase family protein [Desulfolucanica intricata]
MRKRVFFYVKLLAVILSVNILLSLSAAAVYAAVEPSTSEPISTGVELNTYWSGGTKIYVVKVDLANPYVFLDTMVGIDGTFSQAQNVTEMAKRTGAVAGINGGFFQMKNHRSIGLVFHDGKMVASPAQRQDMPGFGITKDNRIVMDIFGFSGQVYAENGNSFPLFGVNKPDYLLPTGQSADLNSLNMYTPLWGARSRDDFNNLSGVVEVVVQQGEVIAVNQDKPGISIPQNGYVLEGHGLAAKFLLENLPVGSKVEVEYTVSPESANLRGAVGGNTLLVQNGQVASFTQEVSGKVARSAVGIMPDGKTLYLAAAEKSAVSAGMTQREMAQFLVSLGVERAVNLDGGGSTTLAARHLGDFNASLVNTPQAGWQRSVPEAIGVFSTAPKGNLAGLIVNGPDVVLGGTSGLYSVKGYDEYYNPFSVDPQDISWSAEPGGEIAAGLFKPLNGGHAKVVAAVNGIRGEKDVKVIGPEDLLALKVEPAVISVDPGSVVTLKFGVTAKSGEVFNLTAENVQVALTGEVGSVSGATFTAGQNPGVGELTVSFQGLTVVIPVTVKSPGTLLQVLPEKSTQYDPDENTIIEFPAGAVNVPLDIEVKSLDGTEIPGYKVLKVLDVSNPQGAAVSLAVPWRFQYNIDEVYGLAVQEQQVYEGFDGADVFIPVEKNSSNDAKAENYCVKVLYKAEGSNDWISQPSIVEKSLQERETVIARIKGLGQVAVVLDNLPAPSFSDIKGHWSQMMVEDMAAQGIINGYPNGTFRPEQPVTRAEFVSLLYRGLLWPKASKQPAFKDEIPGWAADAVASAVEREVVSGYPDGTFKSSKGISRAEMAVIINRFLNLPEVPKQNEQIFYDKDAFQAWYADHVNRVAAAGILKGDNGKFRPDDSATRAEIAAAVGRVLAYWLKN